MMIHQSATAAIIHDELSTSNHVALSSDTSTEKVTDPSHVFTFVLISICFASENFGKFITLEYVTHVVSSDTASSVL
jgi:hypothetical protein